MAFPSKADPKRSQATQVQPKQRRGRTTMSIEAMNQALEAYCKTLHPLWNTRISRTEAEGFFEAGFKAAIAEAEEQEPVAWADHGVLNWIADMQFKHASYLYTHPQPKQEPIAEVIRDGSNAEIIRFLPAGLHLQVGDKLYDRPQPKREWVGLTDEEHTEIQKQTPYTEFMSPSGFAALCQAAVEAKLKEKNT